MKLKEFYFIIHFSANAALPVGAGGDVIAHQQQQQQHQQQQQQHQLVMPDICLWSVVYLLWFSGIRHQIPRGVRGPRGTVVSLMTTHTLTVRVRGQRSEG